MFVQWSRVCVLAALVSLFASSGMAQSAPEARSGGFDFYVLTLSWSPAFCESGGGREYRAQCEPGLGKGFVTHGLWPQYEHGFPSECDGAATPSRMALEHVAGVYPDEGLARHEWRKHGRCSGKSPTDYFLDVRRATESVTIPALLERSRQAQSFAPLDIQRAFIAANPRLRPGMLAVTCRKGALQDVRICFSRDLREFRPCPEIARGACRAGEISVPAPL
ncbi:ribonuclease T2 family protein [Methylosinus sp. LW4]|uniref:ribonuclease T2 family protein n=1 Tax=Methylosinus sp. LW4 TaxID=136993 RepID=UPI00039F3368|nr:ribonuclease T2 [Methylosinus sp. LW4]